MAKSFVWRIVEFVAGGVFIFAGLTKIFDLDRLLADFRHLRVANLLVDLQHIQFANPMGFAIDIDNYKTLPWVVAVPLSFYLPGLEILCGLALIFRFLYRGGLSILATLTSVFIVATIAAKVRALDITCGCFGHVSKNWSFSQHLALDLAILVALALLLRKPTIPSQ